MARRQSESGAALGGRCQGLGFPLAEPEAEASRRDAEGGMKKD